tara:strand:- start:31450 stop:32247 length:798 start_codon:yes stop_codon:yes gene_type:complete
MNREDLKIYHKFVEQLQLYICDMKDFHELMVHKELSEDKQKMLLDVIHKVAGLCLTFNLTEEGGIAKFIEMRLRDVFKFSKDDAMQQADTLLKNLINVCSEGCEEASLKLPRGVDEPLKDYDMHTKHERLPRGLKLEPQKNEDGLHILVVDDDPVIRMLAERKLKLKGYKVTVAKDGVLAVKLAKTILPDLILMDGSMPNMDGMEAAELLRDDPATYNIPIFLLTAYEMSDLNDGHRRDLIDVYIQKPFNVDEVVSQIVKQFQSA